MIKYIQVCFILALTFAPATAQIVDSAQCFSQFTKFNVCEYARKVQAETAPLLPMKISANVTLFNIIAVGPRVMMTAQWQFTKAQIDQMFSALSGEETSSRMQHLASNGVCSDPVLSAFVRLGGAVQYTYKSTDGFNLFSPTVSNCPR